MNLFNTILVLFIYFLIKIQCVCSKTNFSKACDEMDSVSLLEACQQFAAGFLFPHAALEQVKMHFSRGVWKAAWVARVDLLQPFISFTASALSFFSVCMQNLFFFFGEVERFDQIHHSASGILCCWVFAFPDRGSD